MKLQSVEKQGFGVKFANSYKKRFQVSGFSVPAAAVITDVLWQDPLW